MSTQSLHPQLDLLSSEIDTLTTSLSPLLSRPLSSSASKLPLLDKAKLHVLTTYALESILFSYLKLNGVDAKTHPIFAELARVKSYFAKISSAEKRSGGQADEETPQQRLNTGVAKRFVAQGLAGNERYDREREERESRGVKRGRHTKFGDDEKGEREGETREKRVKVVRARDTEEEDEEDSDDDDEERGDEEGEDGEEEEEGGGGGGISSGAGAGGISGGKGRRKRRGMTANAVEKKARLKAKKERRQARKEREVREGEMQ